MATETRTIRPLSPHIQIYRWQIPMLTSIITRITGNALAVSAVLVVWWLLALASGPDAYALANSVITSWFGDIVMVLSAWGLWYHYLAGLRHLYYDAGKGLDIPTAEKLGLAVVAGSVVLTVLTVIIV
jgi:succinate dehydrogenase / fumarate reductase cytochrome b subunit